MKKRLLVVDDDAAVRESIRQLLEATGYEAISAPDGSAAAAQWEQKQIDLAILDLDLPRQSGWDVFENLTRQHPCIPVIIITGLTHQYRTAQAAGVGALLEKPIEATTLLSTVEELLNEPEEKRLRRMCGFQSDTRYIKKPVALPRRNASRSGAKGKLSL